MIDLRCWIRSCCLVGLIGATGVVAAAEPALCAALRKGHEASGRTGQVLETVAIAATEAEPWNLRVPNVDIDGDDVSDSILLYRSPTSSRFPADAMQARVTLSATGKTYTSEHPHIALRRFRSRIYLIGVAYAEAGATARLDVHRIDRRGLNRQCSITVPAA